MATNTAYTETTRTPASGAACPKRAITPTPSQILIGAIWVAAVLVLLGAIAHVAQEQVRKGMSLHGQARSDPHATIGSAGTDSSDANRVSTGHAISFNPTTYTQSATY